MKHTEYTLDKRKELHTFPTPVEGPVFDLRTILIHTGSP
jgi:hypothetical protein